MNKENTQKEQSQPFGVQNLNINTSNNIQQNTNEPQVNQNSQPLTSLRGGNEMSDIQNNIQISKDNNMNDNCGQQLNNYNNSNSNDNDIIDNNSVANHSNKNDTLTTTPVPEPKTWSINPINSIMTFEYTEDAKALPLKDHLESVEKGFNSIKELFAEMYKIEEDCSVLVTQYDTRIQKLNEKIKSQKLMKDKLSNKIEYLNDQKSF